MPIASPHAQEPVEGQESQGEADGSSADGNDLQNVNLLIGEVCISRQRGAQSA